MRWYVTRTTLTSNTQAAPCLPARTFISIAFHFQVLMTAVHSVFLSSLFFSPAAASLVKCSGPNCASECTAVNCGSTLPVPPLLNRALAFTHLRRVGMRYVNCVPFPSTDDCFIFLFPPLPFLFSTLQFHAQERTAPTSARRHIAAVRHEPPLLNLLIQSYLWFFFLFFSLRVCSCIYLFASRCNAVCQLRSFSSADDCFMFPLLYDLPPFLFPRCCLFRAMQRS